MIVKLSDPVDPTHGPPAADGRTQNDDLQTISRGINNPNAIYCALDEQQRWFDAQAGAVSCLKAPLSVALSHWRVRSHPNPPQPGAHRSVKEETSFLETLWECDPRWKDTFRPYSARDVVSLQGSIQQTYAGESMSRKLYATLRDCQARTKA